MGEMGEVPVAISSMCEDSKLVEYVFNAGEDIINGGGGWPETVTRQP